MNSLQEFRSYLINYRLYKFMPWLPQNPRDKVLLISKNRWKLTTINHSDRITATNTKRKKKDFVKTFRFTSLESCKLTPTSAYISFYLTLCYYYSYLITGFNIFNRSTKHRNIKQSKKKSLKQFTLNLNQIYSSAINSAKSQRVILCNRSKPDTRVCVDWPRIWS